MRRNMCAFVATGTALAMAGGAALGDVLWDNGGMVTHPEAGIGPAAGFDFSMAGQPGDVTAAGSNVLSQTTGDHFRVADDFEVDGGPWTIDEITVHAYETNANIPGWFAGDMNIWDGRPEDPGSQIVASADSPVIAQTNIYRIFNATTGSGTFDNTQRLINSITFDFEGLELPDGEYWIDFQLEGGASAWVAYVMEPNPSDPDNPTTVIGNARQMTVANLWQDLNAEGPCEVPFLVMGSADVCIADWNGDGEVDINDFFAYLSDFEDGDPRADLNNDGEIDINDFFIFLSEFEAGC